MPPKKIKKTSVKKPSVKKPSVKKLKLKPFPKPVKRTLDIKMPYTAKGKNLELLKTLTKYGTEYGYINSRLSAITSMTIKSQKDDEYKIEFVIIAGDRNTSLTAIKNKNLIWEFNKMKRLIIKRSITKYTPEVLSKLKFIK
tara:strand:- start:69 stop:491 length:423 start_codon:yes stop_codon:yes gene_type:complete